jgi:hypothetical protein
MEGIKKLTFIGQQFLRAHGDHSNSTKATKMKTLFRKQFSVIVAPVSGTGYI